MYINLYLLNLNKSRRNRNFKCVDFNSNTLSSVMEVLLVLKQSHWWDKAYTLYMEPAAYISFKVFFAYFACRFIIEYAKSYGRQTHDCRY